MLSIVVVCFLMVVLVWCVDVSCCRVVGVAVVVAVVVVVVVVLCCVDCCWL